MLSMEKLNMSRKKFINFKREKLSIAMCKGLISFTR